MQPQMTPSRHEQALTKIAICIRDCPDTGGGVQLRGFSGPSTISIIC